jgi:FtsH-binding integral membrane protein
MKYFRVGLPIIVVLAIIANFFLSLNADNSAAMWANVTAFFGWIVIAGEEILHYRNKHMNKDAV